MTQEEIIEMARRSNILEKMGYDNPDMKNWQSDVVRELSVFAKLVAEKEYEACAEICETYSRRTALDLSNCIDAIRARGQA